MEVVLPPPLLFRIAVPSARKLASRLTLAEEEEEEEEEESASSSEEELAGRPNPEDVMLSRRA